MMACLGLRKQAAYSMVVANPSEASFSGTIGTE